MSTAIDTALGATALGDIDRLLREVEDDDRGSAGSMFDPLGHLPDVADDDPFAVDEYEDDSYEDTADGDSDDAESGGLTDLLRGAGVPVDADSDSTTRKPRRKAKARRPAPVARPGGEEYHPRRLGGRVDVEALQASRDAGLFVALRGYPGCGKTALVEAAHPDVVTVACHEDMEVGDLIGTWSRDADRGEYVWHDGPALVAAKEGRTLFLDDASIAPPGVLVRLYPLIDGRRTITVTEHAGEQVTAADGFHCVAAFNPASVGGADVAAAFASRFNLHVDVPSDYQLASDLGVNRRAVRVAARLADMRGSGHIAWAPEMRELLAFKKIEDAFGTDVAAGNLVGLAPEADRDEVEEVVVGHFPSVDGRLTLASR